MTGIIIGSAFRTTRLLDGLQELTVETRDGNVPVHTGRHRIVLLRHASDFATPPHRINHRANLRALAGLGARWIIAANSTGSLHRAIAPGRIVVPHDYLSPWRIETYCEDDVRHVTPGLDPDLRAQIIEAGRQLGIDLLSEAVYAQTLGPRYETPAETRFLAAFADIVGMTMATEADCAAELDLPYASICAVDNFANGIAETPLAHDDLLQRQIETTDRVEELLLRTQELLTA
jgi:5'-methylthioadenosine phosphorylase